MAAVQSVSPANKDRAENRRAFVSKCAALLQQGVCVSIVDLASTRNFNLDDLFLTPRSGLLPARWSRYPATINRHNDLWQVWV